MQLEILQENFSKALLTATRFVSTRAQLPVLGNIYLKTEKNKLLICSTNLEISVAISIGAKIKEEGIITVPGRILSELVTNLNPGPLTLKAEKEILEISSSGFSANISGMNAADFPEIPKDSGKPSFSFPNEVFLQGISQISFAASIDETRPVLTGVLFIFKKDGIVLVATDGFRLSQKRLPLKGVAKERKMILPKNTLIELSRLVTDADEAISFREEENQAIFIFEGTVLSSRILEGEFPDFEKIIPKETKIKVSLDKEDLLRAVKLASVFAKDSANIVRFSLKKDSLLVSAESQLSGKQEGEIEAKTEGLSGEFEIAFNYRFLEEFLHAVKGEDVIIGLSSENSPGVFRDPGDPGFLHLIMPVRVQV